MRRSRQGGGGGTMRDVRGKAVGGACLRKCYAFSAVMDNGQGVGLSTVTRPAPLKVTCDTYVTTVNVPV